MKNTSYDLPLIIYDDNCTLCTRFKDALSNMRSDKAINFVPLSDKKVFEKYPFVDPVACNDVIHLIDETSKVYKASEAVHYLMHFYPSISKIAWLLDNQAGKKALELFYNAINTYRKSSLSSCKSCKEK